MITENLLKSQGFKQKRYFKKKWSWRKFRFIKIETDTDKLIMEKNGENYCFEYPDYVTRKDENDNISQIN